MTSNGAPDHARPTQQAFDIDWRLIPEPPQGEPTVIVGYD
jgi:hypothetical protein